ncbi:hypothetical protein OIU84_004238, partial [Salix udensis]
MRYNGYYKSTAHTLQPTFAAENDFCVEYCLGCACIFELLAEPLYILSQNLLLLKLRLIVDSVHPSFQTNQQ